MALVHPAVKKAGAAPAVAKLPDNIVLIEDEQAEAEIKAKKSEVDAKKEAAKQARVQVEAAQTLLAQLNQGSREASEAKEELRQALADKTTADEEEKTCRAELEAIRVKYKTNASPEAENGREARLKEKFEQKKKLEAQKQLAEEAARMARGEVPSAQGGDVTPELMAAPSQVAQGGRKPRSESESESEEPSRDRGRKNDDKLFELDREVSETIASLKENLEEQSQKATATDIRIESLEDDAAGYMKKLTGLPEWTEGPLGSESRPTKRILSDAVWQALRSVKPGLPRQIQDIDFDIEKREAKVVFFKKQQAEPFRFLAKTEKL